LNAVVGRETGVSALSLQETAMPKKNLGRYIVADPEVCHGKPTFKGTRILVEQVLGQGGKVLSWDAIIDEWRGDISMDAIAEAVELARRSFAREPAETLTT